MFGRAFTATGSADGVYGFSDLASTGFGVYAGGDLGASGLKSFVIDHPLDPENKSILHYCAESPMPQNFYVGNCVTDSKGRAWVELPEYFASINTNFKYQLTVVDDSESEDFVQVKVGKEIRENRFLIMSSSPNVKVSWRVDADRNDPYVQYKKPKDIREKTGIAKGTYEYPELYGQPAEKALVNVKTRNISSQNRK